MGAAFFIPPVARDKSATDGAPSKRIPFGNDKQGGMRLLLDFVEEYGALRVELLEEIEVGDVAGEDGETGAGGGEVDQGVVEGAAAVRGAMLLQAGYQPGEDTGLGPGGGVWCDGAGVGTYIKQCKDLFHGFGCAGMAGIEKTSQDGKLAGGD